MARDVRETLRRISATHGAMASWISAPTLHLAALGIVSQPNYVRLLRRPQRRQSRSTFVWRGSGRTVLVVAGTSNQRRVVESLRLVGLPNGVDETLGVWETQGRIAVLERPSSDLDVNSIGHRAIAWLAEAARLLDLVSPDVVLLTNQHSVPYRAILAEAARRNLPSVYVPHAPLADNVGYRDLPVTHALLRGRAEQEFYEGLGAQSNRLTVVGNPAAEEVDRVDRNGPIVLALSPRPLGELRDIAEFVLKAVNAPIVVAPHPRSDVRRVQQVVPSAWGIHDGRTVDLLNLGARCLIQRSSGIAWEGLARGLPVIQLGAASEDGNYPLIKEPFVLFAPTVEALRAAVAHADSWTEESARQAIVWASKWASPLGSEAAKRILEYLWTDASCWMSEPILDSWASE